MGFRNMYISASAGSGKTYRLVNRFLALLCLQKLERGTDVSRIIAITFTRKAAGEFRERILSALAEGALDSAAAASLWHQRLLPTISDPAHGMMPGREITLPDTPEVFFRDLLTDVMRQFPKLNLGTIDSLFHNMVSALAYELGLSRFDNLSNEKEEIARRKALHNAYRLADNTPELSDAIQESLPNESTLSRLDTYLQRLVADYHREALDSAPEAWGDRNGELTEQAMVDFHATREELTLGISEESFLRQVNVMQEILDVDFAGVRGSKGIGDYIRALASFNGQLKAGGSKVWREFFDACRSAGIHVEEMEHTRRALIWKKLLQRTDALRRLLDAYEKGYDREVRSHGLFTFDDVPRLLAGHSNAECVARLCERTDASLEHWLLDEFQDTAQNQYRILQDMLQARAQGEDEGSVLMVGDAKQSIYRFRGGDPNLFLNSRGQLFGLKTGQNYPQGTEYSAEQHLNVSYRSARSVLDMANDLFLDIDRTARCAAPKARETWKRLGYGAHLSAAGAEKRLGCGCAQVWQAAKVPQGEGGRNDNVYRTIAHLLAQARPLGSRRGTCAILVRTGKQGTDLENALNSLRAEFPFAGDLAVCNDKEVGHDSPLGQALLQLFCWMDNPADVKNLGLLRLSPLWRPGVNEAERWEELNDILAAGGVSAVLESLMPRLRDILAVNDFLHLRMKIWVDEAAAFDAEGGTLSDWIARMRRVTHREEPQGDVIQIMTIHKAKGLEFDMVIIPLFSPAKKMADYRTDKVSLLCRKNEDDTPLALILPPPRDKGVVEGMAAQFLAQEWQADQEFAAFCELYVAVTRAKRATYVVHPHVEKAADFLDPDKQDGESFLGMMIQLAAEHPAPAVPPTCDSATCTYALGEHEWWRHLPMVEDPPPTAPASGKPAENYCFATLARHTPSSMDRDRECDDDSREAETALPAPVQREEPRCLRDTGGASFGSTVHALFERIAWLAPGEEVTFRPDDDARAVATVRQALANPTMACHFRRPACSSRLYREQNIEALSKGSWISGQIDRLVVEYENDRPVRARIYDYKTDAAIAPAALAENYRTQMSAYRKLICLAFHLPPAAVSVTLLHVSASAEPQAIPIVF